MDRFYVVQVWGAVEASLVSDSHATFEDMLKTAQGLRKEQRPEYDSIHWLKIDEKGEPSIGDFTESNMDDVVFGTSTEVNQPE